MAFRRDLLKRIGPRIEKIAGDHWLTALNLVSFEGRMMTPRHALWLYHRKPRLEPNVQLLRATCGVRPCINPDHASIFVAADIHPMTPKQRVKNYYVAHSKCEHCGAHIPRYIHGDTNHVSTFFMTKTCPSCLLKRESKEVNPFKEHRVVDWEGIQDLSDLEIYHRKLDMADNQVTNDLVPQVRDVTADEAARIQEERYAQHQRWLHADSRTGGMGATR
jgi:hypothetical protein